MGEAILKIQDLKKVYPDGTQALRGINVNINKGELVAVIGSSGAGKSTFLRCINRLNNSTGGSILFNEKEVTKARGKELRNIRREIGMVFQSFNLIKRSRTVKNVLHGRLGYVNSIKGGLGLFSEEDTKNALTMLGRVGLTDQAFKRADELSGGQQQRVGVARALAQKPKLLLADEPIASLDPASSERVMSYMKKICMEDGITAIVNLHQVEVAKQFATRIIGIKEGQIVFDGTARELTDEIIKYLYD